MLICTEVGEATTGVEDAAGGRAEEGALEWSMMDASTLENISLGDIDDSEELWLFGGGETT